MLRSYPQCTIKQCRLDEESHNGLFIPFRLKQTNTAACDVPQLLCRRSAGLLRQQVELFGWERPQKLSRCSDEMSGNSYVHIGFSPLKKNYVSPSNCFLFSSHVQCVWHLGTFGPRSRFECHPWYKRSVVSAELFNREVSITAVVIKARQQNPIQTVW